MENLIVYSNGLVHCSVCADNNLSKEEVERLVNARNCAGTQNGWKIDTEKFADGGDNPHQCEKDENRLHYLMVC